MKEKVMRAVKSRTIWSLIALFIISGVEGITGLIPASLLPLVQALLGIMVVYFKVNPSQDY